MSKRAVIFDLDGVIVSTDEFHYEAWKQMAEDEGIYFDKKINERLRGVSRMESLEIILERSETLYTLQKKEDLAERKNNYYRNLLNTLSEMDILPGVMNVLKALKELGIKIAIGSSSKNKPFILERIKLDGYFDAVADGNEIKYSKPHPEVFLLAAAKLGMDAFECVVIEDADAGIEAANAGGMKAVGVGFAANCLNAKYRIKDLSLISIDELLKD